MRLYGPDALRGIAAIMVAGWHWQDTFKVGQGLFDPILPVTLFFMLSGFVMARTYEAKMRDGLTPARFLALRYRRLFFPAAVGTLIGLAVVKLNGADGLTAATAFLVAIAFMPAAWLGNCFILNIPMWSLFVEIALNAMHVTGFVKLRDKALPAAIAVSGSVFAVGRLHGVFAWGPDLWSILGLLPGGMTAYLIGIWIYRRCGDAPLGDRPLAAVIAFPICLLLLHQMLPANWQEIAFVLVICPLIIRASMGLRESKTAYWFGALSFPLYAVHVPVFDLFRAFGSAGMVGGPAAALGLAWLLAYQFQRSHRRLTAVPAVA